uniref:Cyclin-dependent kinase inhibitor domain-containing protein n=1 Tax=Neogobius melanostomus TaxID=47308 RepID=A0A8C6WN32_9GOBI
AFAHKGERRTTAMGTARRSLFGPVNHEQLRRELSQRLRDITERDSRRWNFDFQRDAPLPGRFQWEEVPAERTAAFYGQGKDRDVSAQSQGSEERLRPCEEDKKRASDQENCPRVSNTPKRPAELTPARRKRARSKSAARAPQNTRITGDKLKARLANLCIYII